MRPVLVTDGGNGQSRSALSAVRALSAAGRPVHVTTTGRASISGWSRHCSRSIPGPDVSTPAYESFIRMLLMTGDYVTAFPASDAALGALGWPGHSLVDKTEVARKAVQAGLPLPEERVFDDVWALKEHASALPYPVAIKAVVRDGLHAPPVRRANSAGEVAAMSPQQGRLLVQEWLEGDMRAASGVIWDGKLRAVVHQRYLRTWPRECGVASSAVTVEPDFALEESIRRLLHQYDGLFQVQLIGDYVIDVNPRVYGSMALAVRAGVNLPDIVCNLTVGKTVMADSPRRGRIGVHYRWVEGDLRHLIGTLRRRDRGVVDVARAFKPHRDTAHGDVSVSDPAPSVARLLHAAQVAALATQRLAVRSVGTRRSLGVGDSRVSEDS